MLWVHVKSFLTALFWGGTFIAGRIVAKSVDPFSAAFLRFAVASIFLLLLAFKVEGRLPVSKASQVIPVIVLGMTGVFAYNVFFFKGLRIIEASRAGLIVATVPIFITIFSSYFFKKKLTVMKVAGGLICVSGAIIVVSRGKAGGLLNGLTQTLKRLAGRYPKTPMLRSSS